MTSEQAGVRQLRVVADAARRLTTTGAAGIVTAWHWWPHADDTSSTGLVLLHGSYGSWTHWLRNIPVLQDGCTVVCPDVPGFGDSGDAPAARSPSDIGRVVAEGLLSWRSQTRASVKRWIIGGFSLGAVYAGWLARHLADVHSETIAGVALVSPGGLGPRDERDLGMRRIPAGMDVEKQREVHRHNLQAVMFGRPELIDETAIRVQHDNVARARFRGPFAPSPDFLLQALSGTRWPVVGIWGDRDAFDLDVSVRAAALRRVRPDAQLHIVRGVGHWVPYEAADEVNAVLSGMLDREST